LGEEERVTINAVQALVTDLALMAIEAVHHVLAVVDAIRVETILIVIGLRDEVAVLGVAGIVHIVAVLYRPHDHEPRLMRDLVAKFRELREERPREINVLPVLQRIPSVAPPRLGTVDRKGMVRMELREDALISEVALPPVEFAGIPF
jgi:hypothetical protein